MDDDEIIGLTAQRTWHVKRHGEVREVRRSSDNALRYQVRVWDEGRPPFLHKWFNDPVPAADFLDNLVNAGEN